VLPEYLDCRSNGQDDIRARLFLKGEAVFKHAGEKWHCGERGWFFSPRDTYEQHFTPGTRIISICFRMHWLTNRPIYDHEHPLLLSAEEHPQLQSAAEALCAVLGKHRDKEGPHMRLKVFHAAAGLEIDLAFGQWLHTYALTMERAGCLSTGKTEVDLRVEKALRYIQTHLDDQSLSSRSLAERVGVSPSHFARLFKDATDRSVGEFLSQRRRAWVIEAVRDRGLTIKEAAYSLGFTSLPHFSRWFKAQTGRAPRQFFRNVEL
jgi:AraC-like DNA-binding protein